MNQLRIKKGRRSSILTVTVVMAVMGLVAAMAIPQFSAYRGRSSTSAGNYMDPVVRLRSSSIPGTAHVNDPVPIDFNTEEYDRIYENRFKDVSESPLSTFSIDVDTASYANVRRYLRMNQMPPKDAVRIEEMVNYFSYAYPEPRDEHPFSITTETATCPWNRDNLLVHIGLQGRPLDYENVKPCNLVFLIDSSGSMNSANKLPLLKKAFRLLLDGLGENDRVAMVAYAGSAGLVLPSTPASNRQRILGAIESLRAGGSTAGGAGIRLAYRVAEENLLKDGNNRVILATDGDFNIGVSSTSELVRLIEEKRKKDIYLTICGFGMGNYKDGRMEQISNAGNGNYFYVDNIREAEKIFVTDIRGTLFTIAKDVKIQIEFNPAKIKAFRLIGYENRILAREDFNDDQKDAGELGAGHTVTALYEVIPAGSPSPTRTSDPLKYQQTIVRSAASETMEMMTVKLRYKPPKEYVSRLMVHPVVEDTFALNESSTDFRFSAAVAGFGMLLRDSEFKGSLTYQDVLAMARQARGKDAEGYRTEFINLVKTCALLHG